MWPYSANRGALKSETTGIENKKNKARIKNAASASLGTLVARQAPNLYRIGLKRYLSRYVKVNRGQQVYSRTERVEKDPIKRTRGVVAVKFAKVERVKKRAGVRGSGKGERILAR